MACDDNSALVVCRVVVLAAIAICAAPPYGDNGARVAAAGELVAAASGAPAAEGLLSDRAVLARLAVGPMAKFRFRTAPQPLPNLALVTADGRTRTLADWSGRFVLLNVWASWCAPCREEMPALQRLQSRLAGESFAVVTLSIDKSPAAAFAFLEQLGLGALPLLVDADLAVSKALSISGAPTSLLIDANGRELGRIEGAADWASDEAVLLVKAMIVKAAAPGAPAAARSP